MSNILNNTTSLQEVLEALQNKAAGGGEQATPTINVNSDGLITATAGTKIATKRLAFQAAKTITPNTTNQIAVSSGYYTGGDIIVKGDSNLVASNIKSGVSIFGVSGTYDSGEVTEYSEAEDGIISRTISGAYTNDRVTSIGAYVFQYCSSLTSVNFPVCTSIGGCAFQSCGSLTSVNFPVCTSIGVSAFQNCSSLISVNFPACTSIGWHTFEYCDSLITVNFPVCTCISKYAFHNCYSLTTVSFPACKSIDWNAFQNCSALTSVNFPACVSINTTAFGDCTSLTSVNFPVCTSISHYAFDGCTSLTTALFGSDIPSTSTTIKAYIFSSAFYSCSKLTNLTLYHPSVAALQNVNAFTSTPMSLSTLTGSFGSIYVPAPLVDAYKLATNWAAYSARIMAIPGTEDWVIDGDTGGDTGGDVEVPEPPEVSG